MPQPRAWLKKHLSPNTVDALRTVRHASAQAIAGADLFHLRVDLERRIEERLRDTDAAQDARLMMAMREELTAELDRWGQDMMDRMDMLLAASARLAGALEDRVAELERRLSSEVANAANGRPAGQASRAEPRERIKH